MNTRTFAHTVFIRRRTTGTVDAEGNVIRAWLPAVEYPGRLYRKTGTEVLDNRTVETVTTKLMLPPDAVVGPHDQAVVDGITYEVDGEPYRVAASTLNHHVELDLKVVA